MEVLQEDILKYFRTKKSAYAGPMAVSKMLKQGVDSDIVVIDVRNPVAPIPSTIEGAVWIPEAQITSRMNELPKDKTLVLVCWDTWCGLATSAAIPLLENGFKVKELNGGIAAWKKLHLPEVALEQKVEAQGSHC